MSALLALDRVSFAYGGETILRDASLEVAEGEALAVTGPSGSGKTTLLGLLSLLLEPTSGTVRVRGRDAAALSDAERSRLRGTFCGAVFQAAHLVGSLSVLDNVLVPAFLAGERPDRRGARALLERLGLGDRLGHLPHQLSVGQRRRVAIARALIRRPAVVLADEPTNDLDPARAAAVAGFLLGLPAQGHALVLVTHDPLLAGRAARRLRIEAGRLLPAAEPEAVPA